MTLADLIKEFLDSTKERLKTPISGAFLWSFIIYNWRAVLVLLFSDATIENKIIVINHEYCTFWALFVPIVIATFYSLLIPRIMLLIDKDLASTKKERIDNIYEVKLHQVLQRKKLAKEEFELKDIESGNQSKQELIDKIATLEESNRQRAEADRNTINDLNKKLKEINSIYSGLSDSGQKDIAEQFQVELTKSLKRMRANEEPLIANHIANVVRELSLDEVITLRSLIETDQKISPRSIMQTPTTVMDALVNKGILQVHDSGTYRGMSFTDIGRKIHSVFDFVNEEYQ